MGVVVAIDSADAKSKIAISNGHCIDRVVQNGTYQTLCIQILLLSIRGPLF